MLLPKLSKIYLTRRENYLKRSLDATEMMTEGILEPCKMRQQWTIPQLTKILISTSLDKIPL